MYQHVIGKRGNTGDVRVGVSEYGGKRSVDIRRFFQLPTGTWHPTKKGVSLTAEEWDILKGLIYEIDHAVRETKGSSDEDWGSYTPNSVHGVGVDKKMQSPFGGFDSKHTL